MLALSHRGTNRISIQWFLNNDRFRRCLPRLPVRHGWQSWNNNFIWSTSKCIPALRDGLFVAFEVSFRKLQRNGFVKNILYNFRCMNSAKRYIGIELSSMKHNFVWGIRIWKRQWLLELTQDRYSSYKKIVTSSGSTSKLLDAA